MLLANHGPIVSGASLEEAVYAYEELEETAKLHFILGDRPTSPLNAGAGRRPQPGVPELTDLQKGTVMSFAYSEGDPVEDTSRHGKPPFDTDRLDRLMEEAGLDALLVTTKHSIQYLLGGYRFFFYDYMDAHGLSRYLPFFVYVKGRPLDSGYVGAPMERYEKQLGSFWVTNLDLKQSTRAPATPPRPPRCSSASAAPRAGSASRSGSCRSTPSGCSKRSCPELS